MDEHLRFDGRVAIVTGGGRGLGRSHCRFLAERGATVVVNDAGTAMDGSGHDLSPADAVVDEIKRAGGHATADANDISTDHGAETLVRQAIEAHGHVDIVVNNAGILRWTEFADTDEQELSAHLAVHVHGSFNVTHAVWPHFVSQRFGRVIMTTSSAIFGGSTIASYSSAKAALIGLTHSLAASGRPHGINVNAIAPTAWTRMMESAGFQADSDLAREMPAELVSPAVVYLAHPSCDASGLLLAVGGGRVARLFVAESKGYVTDRLTPELLQKHWESVNELETFVVPSSTDAYHDEVRSFNS